MKNNFIIDLTACGLFSGLYCTIWTDEGSIQEEDAQRYAEILGIETDDIYISYSFNKLLKEIADLYINVLENELGGVFEYYDSYSPEFYNFDNDHILLTWSKEGKTAEELKSDFNDFLKNIGDLTEYEIFNVFDYSGRGENIKAENAFYSVFNGCQWFYIESDYNGHVWLEKC